jgi:uncharacterized protein
VSGANLRRRSAVRPPERETLSGRRVPDPDGPSGDFYARARAGELCIQRCSSCGTWRHPPRLRCASCGAEAVAWEQVSGRGRLFSWTVTHQAFDPAFAARVPYVTSVVELTEGPRLVALFEGDRADLRLDRPVEVGFDPSEPGAGLLVCRPI